MAWKAWYDALGKPSWTPEPATIGLIWQILYPIILVTFGFVFLQALRKKVPWTAALPFGLGASLYLGLSAGLAYGGLAALQHRYRGCLCLSCLQAVASGAPISAGPAAAAS